jgi:F-type H+-transporting ATPase subunit delta
MTPYTPRQYARALDAALREADASIHDTIVERFVALVHEDGMTDSIDAIITAFDICGRERAGIVSATVYATAPLSPERTEAIATYVTSRTHARGVHVTEHLDTRLLGGVRIMYGDRLLDASVRSRLSALARALYA